MGPLHIKEKKSRFVSTVEGEIIMGLKIVLLEFEEFKNINGHTQIVVMNQYEYIFWLQLNKCNTSYHYHVEAGCTADF